MDAAVLQPAAARRGPRPTREKLGRTSAVEHDVRHVAVKGRRPRERAHRGAARGRCGRSAQANRPTSISANDDDGVLHARRGRRVAAVPGPDLRRRGAAASARAEDHAEQREHERAAPRSRRDTQTSGAMRLSCRRRRGGGSGAQATTAASSTRRRPAARPGR